MTTKGFWVVFLPIILTAMLFGCAVSSQQPARVPPITSGDLTFWYRTNTNTLPFDVLASDQTLTVNHSISSDELSTTLAEACRVFPELKPNRGLSIYVIDEQGVKQRLAVYGADHRLILFQKNDPFNQNSVVLPPNFCAKPE